MSEVCTYVKYHSSLVRPLKNANLRPFDTHLDLPPISKDSHYRCKLRKIGFDTSSNTATLTLALLPLMVEVTLNLAISLRHSSRQRRTSFNEVKVETALSLVNHQALPSLVKKSLANSSTQKRNFSLRCKPPWTLRTHHESLPLRSRTHCTSHRQKHLPTRIQYG
jgi:hypothetical protein